MPRHTTTVESRDALNLRVQQFLREKLNLPDCVILINMNTSPEPMSLLNKVHLLQMRHALSCSDYDSFMQPAWIRLPNTSYKIGYYLCRQCNNCCYVIFDM